MTDRDAKRARRIEAARQLYARATTDGEREAARAAIERMGGTVQAPTSGGPTQTTHRSNKHYVRYADPRFNPRTGPGSYPGAAEEALRDLFNSGLRDEQGVRDEMRRVFEEQQARQARDQAEVRRKARTQHQVSLREDARRLRELADALDVEASAMTAMVPGYTQAKFALSRHGWKPEDISDTLSDLKDRIDDVADALDDSRWTSEW